MYPKPKSEASGLKAGCFHMITAMLCQLKYLNSHFHVAEPLHLIHPDTVSSDRIVVQDGNPNSDQKVKRPLPLILEKSEERVKHRRRNNISRTHAHTNNIACIQKLSKGDIPRLDVLIFRSIFCVGDLGSTSLTLRFPFRPNKRTQRPSPVSPGSLCSHSCQHLASDHGFF